MRRAVKLWETSQYWQDRAAGAIRHAKYKELPAVRARRIKKLEAERRSHERDLKASTAFLALWKKLDQDGSIRKASGEPSTFQERAAHIANLDRSMTGLWSEIESGRMIPAEAQARYSANHERIIAESNRWIAHLDNRLTYERALLAEQRVPAAGQEADQGRASDSQLRGRGFGAEPLRGRGQDRHRRWHHQGRVGEGPR
jgi:hypothetical protein